ncbi:hypothetical protein UA45_13180 [Morganella morganii]|uniref:Uncharacterized protein n=1 Tax=Morganella morganii TaxID=582 RepID=A0A0D8L688_MORMO|nr:hypothetical protein UA45_13180 [Morganella morganii]
MGSTIAVTARCTRTQEYRGRKAHIIRIFRVSGYLCECKVTAGLFRCISVVRHVSPEMHYIIFRSAGQMWSDILPDDKKGLAPIMQ